MWKRYECSEKGSTIISIKIDVCIQFCVQFTTLYIIPFAQSDSFIYRYQRLLLI